MFILRVLRYIDQKCLYLISYNRPLPGFCFESSTNSQVSVDLADLESAATLHYENLLYIVSRGLVLDVDGSKKIFVTKKDSSRRSQLWRIDSRGTLVNAHHTNHVLDPTTLQMTVYGRRSKIHTWHFREEILCFGTKQLYLNNLERLCFLQEHEAPHIHGQGLTAFRPGYNFLAQRAPYIEASLITAHG